jgi:Tfp pilus assembly PilM family ATPase
MDVFEAEGFRVEALTTHASALTGACGAMLRGQAGSAGILDIGWDAARLVLLYREVVVYQRKLAKGGVGALVNALAHQRGQEPVAVERLLMATDLSAPQAVGPRGPAAEDLRAAAGDYFAEMIEEMKMPLSYLANQYPDATMQRLLVVGGGAMVPGLVELLAGALGVEVAAASPLPPGRTPHQTDSPCSPALALAVGLGGFEEA